MNNKVADCADAQGWFVHLLFANTKDRFSHVEAQIYIDISILFAYLLYRFGAPHDGSGNDCPNGQYIMSSYGFFPDSNTKDTYSKFSSCSAEYFDAHLER